MRGWSWMYAAAWRVRTQTQFVNGLIKGIKQIRTHTVWRWLSSKKRMYMQFDVFVDEFPIKTGDRIKRNKNYAWINKKAKRCAQVKQKQRTDFNRPRCILDFKSDVCMYINSLFIPKRNHFSIGMTSSLNCFGSLLWRKTLLKNL